MKIEEQVRRAFLEFAERIDADPASWSRIQQGMDARRQGRRHSLAVAAAAVAALVTIIVLALIVDQPRRLDIITPAPGSADQQMLVTPDGDWELRYPRNWYLREASTQDRLAEIRFESEISTAPVEDGAVWAELDGQILVRLVVVEPASTRDPITKVCGPDATPLYDSVLQCTTQTINGRTWSRAVAEGPIHDEDPPGTQVGTVRRMWLFLAASGRQYGALASIYGTERVNERMAVVERIFSSFVIRDPS